MFGTVPTDTVEVNFKQELLARRNSELVNVQDVDLWFLKVLKPNVPVT